MKLKLVRHCAAALIACGSLCVFYGTAEAQLTDDDPFGERDENDAIPKTDQPGIADPSAQALFGTGGVAGELGTAYAPPPVIDPKWSDFGNMSGERIEDTYEMKMRDELKKPLPKRNPFGNRIDDIERGFRPDRK